MRGIRSAHKGWSALSVILAIVVGTSVAAGPIVGVLAVGIVIVLVVVRSSGPVGLILLGLLLAWLARAGQLVELPTEFLSFADLGLVALAFALTLGSPRVDDVPFGLKSGLLLFALVGITSVALVGAPPVQTTLGILLYVEPFMAIFVVIRCASHFSRRQCMQVITLVIAIQAIFATVQWLLIGTGDAMQGSLIGSGAGAHLVGASLLLGAMIFWQKSGWTPRFGWVLLFFTVLIAVADAKQVWIMMPLAIAILYMKARPTGQSAQFSEVRLSRVMAASLTATIVAIPLTALLIRTYIGKIIELTLASGGGKLAVLELLASDLSRNAVDLTVGFGAGETVSRLGWILTPTGGYSESPLANLGLTESEGAQRYQFAAISRGYVGESSLSSSLSSFFGVLGDFGLLGLLAYLIAVSSVIRRLWRSPDVLAAPALALLACLLVLGVVSDWLEQTPITLLMGVVAGLAMGGVPAQQQSVALQRRSRAAGSRRTP